MDYPGLPPTALQAINQYLLVGEEKEARQVHNAVLGYRFNIILAGNNPNLDEHWLPFVDRLRVDGWRYIYELARKYKQAEIDSLRVMYGEWLDCPRCHYRQTVRLGVGWVQCPACGLAFWKQLPGAPALPHV